MLTRKQVISRISLALIVGAVFAGAFTHITYPCAQQAGDAGCASLEKAVMHPIDLISNVQGSLVRFLTDLFVVATIVLLIFSVAYSLRSKKPSNTTGTEA